MRLLARLCLIVLAVNVTGAVGLAQTSPAVTTAEIPIHNSSPSLQSDKLCERR